MYRRPAAAATFAAPSGEPQAPVGTLALTSEIAVAGPGPPTPPATVKMVPPGGAACAASAVMLPASAVVLPASTVTIVPPASAAQVSLRRGTRDVHSEIT